MRQGDVVHFLHTDHLGSTSLTTDATGAPIAQTRYLPYGEQRWTDGDTPTDFTFTGQRADGFGLLDYNARYYDSGLGRFISPDTIVPEPGNPQSLNRYSYALNNSVRYNDPSGHCGPLTPLCVIAGLAGLALVASASEPLPPGEAPPPEQGLLGLALMVAAIAPEVVVIIAETLSGSDIELTSPTPEEIEGNNRQVRQWYNDQVEPISELNESWIEEGLSAEERAQRAYEIRHDARLKAREMMIDRDGVARLQERDIEKYGNPDGPMFEQLVKAAEEKGYSGDDAYEYIVGSSRRTDEDINRRFGVER
jgi:RHS repeat-associated protein